MTRDKYDDAAREIADYVLATGVRFEVAVADALRRVAADATRAGAAAERESFATILRSNIDGWSDNGAKLAATFDVTEGRTRQLAALILSDALECAYMDDRERALNERFADLERRLRALATTTEAHDGPALAAKLLHEAHNPTHRCNVCKRAAWEHGACNMPQPDGLECPGLLVAVST